VGTGRVLLVIAEVLAAIALAVQFLMPIEWIVSIAFGHRSFVLPARWVVSLLLISIAGGVSVIALASMYWRLAHLTIPPPAQ